MYWPRSRGETRSPMIAMALTIRPPAPSPWMARNVISMAMDWDSPASAEPARKITMAVMNSLFRPYMSPSFPYSGVVMVDASTYAVTTQDRCATPPRLPTMRGSAVPTMSWSSMASMMARSSPGSTTSTSRRIFMLGPGLAPGAVAAASVSVMPTPGMNGYLLADRLAWGTRLG